MKKNLLSPIFVALLSAHAHAAANLPENTPSTDTGNAITAAPSATQQAETAPTATPAIDCNYHIPANQTSIDSALITSWAEKAVLQSFTFASTTIQSQLDSLKPCYTELGWRGFNDALQKSGNVESIKTQNLNVTSQTDGAANINTVKDNQWKVTMPIQVVSQNDKEKVTQKLSISVLVGRKPTGDLGIMQLIASTRSDEVNAPSTEKSETPATTPTEIMQQQQQPTTSAESTPK